MSQAGNSARTSGTPLLFAKSTRGSFMTTVSQDLGLTSHPKNGISCSTASLSLLWGNAIDFLARGKIAT